MVGHCVTSYAAPATSQDTSAVIAWASLSATLVVVVATCLTSALPAGCLIVECFKGTDGGLHDYEMAVNSKQDLCVCVCVSGSLHIFVS